MATETKDDEAPATNDRSRVLAAACIGAVIGAVWGWLYLTSSGARIRERLDPILDGAADALDKVQAFRAASSRVAAIALIVAAALAPRAARVDALSSCASAERTLARREAPASSSGPCESMVH